VKHSRRVPGDGPLMKCRECARLTREPLAHSPCHDWPATLAAVWEHFALVGATRVTPRRETPPTQAEALF
jgi:hypothetical protein